MFLQKKGNSVTIHMDATGNIVKQPSTTAKRAFYYAAVIAIKTNINDKHASVYPVTELVSTSHTTDDVGMWLRKFRHFATSEFKQWPVFNRCVTDESWVQLHAICEDWNLMSFTNYIIETHKWAENADAMDKTKLVVISLCSAHKIKNIVKDVNKFIPTGHSGKLIIEILVSMMNINAYQTLKNVWSLLCAVLKSPKLTQQVKDSVQAISKIIFPDIEESIIKATDSSADPDSSEKEFKYEIEKNIKMVRKFYCSNYL